jgi:hypothetical protein
VRQFSVLTASGVFLRNCHHIAKEARMVGDRAPNSGVAEM